MEKAIDEIRQILDMIMSRYEHMQGWLFKVAMDSINVHQLFYDETIRLIEEFQLSDHFEQSLLELKQFQKRYENSVNDKLVIAEQWVEGNKKDIERKKNNILRLVGEIDTHLKRGNSNTREFPN